MRILLLTALGLMFVSAAVAPCMAQKTKVKNKDKRFETVVLPAADYAGRYAGFDAEHYIEVKVDAGGNLAVESFENDRRARLENIKLEQGKLTATKVYEDGTREPFEGTFANRILNGTSSFGLIVEGDIVVTQTLKLNRVFFKRE